MSVLVVYGSDSGATKAIASRIAEEINGTAVDIIDATTSDLESCDLLILGSPTYGDGDLQEDWEQNIDTLKSADLSGKRVALFGLGDQETYPDSFVDALGLLYDEVTMLGAEVVGFTDIVDFTFTESRGQRDGQFVGLALDEDTQPEHTDARIASWIKQFA